MGFFEYISMYLDGKNVYLTLLVNGLTVSFVILLAFRDIMRRRTIVSARKIAVLGLPRSGKTALISAFFDRLNVINRGGRVRIQGAKSIARANATIALLNSRNPIPPTTEDDVFVMRFSYFKSIFLGLFKIVYDIEVADFPGEYTSSLLSDGDFGVKGYGLFSENYYSLLGSAQVYLFLIDLSEVYRVDEPRYFVADLSGRIRASWQIIEENISNRGISNEKSKTVRLVFSKIDSLFSPCFLSENAGNKLLYGPDLFDQKSIIANTGADFKSAHYEDFEDYNDGLRIERIVRDRVLDDFSDLRAYFKNRIVDFDVLFTSVVMRKGGVRYGIDEVIEPLLPK